MGDVQTQALADLGAQVSVIRKDHWERVLARSHTVQGFIPKLRELRGIFVRSAYNERRQVEGCTLLPIKFGPHIYFHKFLVLDQLVCKLILGADFMVQAGIVLDPARRQATLSTLNHTIELVTTSDNALHDRNSLPAVYKDAAITIRPMTVKQCLALPRG